ncbi:Protein LONGIFOLIA like [Heracleum sosnowskyi]|uniref:Protein LONGIFOLIA like n=1 Tax=Heracleum sosnowskyi TaxID=360622 RepID=A0AAD8GZX8_9APIA|nr:Protein LONGIFOLIA like [Heracleum sosnowskyi]
MTTGVAHEQNMQKKIEKQMGCMSGFLQIFDRHQMLSGKRLHTKRLPAPVQGDDVLLEPEKFNKSPGHSKNKKVKSPPVTRSMTLPIPDLYKKTSIEPSSPAMDSSLPAEMPPKSPLPLPLFDVNEGGRNSWKFSPRLSLDSRATFDVAKGNLYRKQTNSSNLSANHCDKSDRGTDGSRRSTSVIAKLMGIETLPDSKSEPVAKQAELRRSASESRVSRDIFQPRMVENDDDDIVKVKQQNHVITSNVIRENYVDQLRRGGSNRGVKSPQQRKSFFNSGDIFPEPTKNVSIYGEIERRLKMRGIDEPSKDLETLKQILEAMQLKGLLHSNPRPRVRNTNIVYDRNFSHSSESQSPIVLMKPLNRRVSDELPSNIGSNSGNRVSSISPRRQRQSIDRNANSPVRARNSSSPTRTEANARSSNSRSNSPVKTKQLTIETQRRGNESKDSQRVSPKISPRRNVADQAVTNRSQIIRRPIEDEFSSSVSESSVITPSQTDTERSKVNEYKEGRRLLDRCDKLLNSIAEMNATESQPSPVSVLDSSYYKDDSSLSPSPVIKRHLSYPVEVEELGSPGISSVLLDCEDDINDSDFTYISKVIRAWNFGPEGATDHIFLQLEKQHYMKNKDASKASKLQRRLIFDTITEIMEQKRNLPPWKALASRPLLQQIWSEFQRIREQQSSDDLFEVICGVLKKDLDGEAINGWGDFPLEISEAVLDIERLIFKDLVGESIRDLAESAAAKRTHLAPSRKLVF